MARKRSRKNTSESTGELTVQETPEVPEKDVEERPRSPRLVRVFNPKNAPVYVPLVTGLVRVGPKGRETLSEDSLTVKAKDMAREGRIHITQNATGER